MVDLNFTVSKVIPLIVRPDAMGQKRQTIRRMGSNDTDMENLYRICDARSTPPRVMGTARIHDRQPLIMDQAEWRSRAWGNLSRTWPVDGLDLRCLAWLDGFRGPEPEVEMRSVLEGMYIHGKGLTFPVDLVVITWRDFVIDLDYSLPGEQLELLT